MDGPLALEGGGRDTFCFAMSTVDAQGVGCEDVRCCPAITPPQARCTPSLGAPWCSMRQCCHPARWAPQPLASWAGGVLVENEFRKAPRRHALGSMALVVCVGVWVCAWPNSPQNCASTTSLSAQPRISIPGAATPSRAPPDPPWWGMSNWDAKCSRSGGARARNSGLLAFPGWADKSLPSDLSGLALPCEPRHTDTSPPMRQPEELLQYITWTPPPKARTRVRGWRPRLKTLLARSMPVGVSGKVLTR